MSEASEFMDELRKIKEEEEKKNQTDIYLRTLQKLLTIEKESLYGKKTSGKNAKFDKVIDAEFKKYRGEK